MNSVVEQELPAVHEMRDQLLHMITDEDLAYKLPGSNPTLGGLCVEMGYIEQAYAQSFKTLTMDWEYRDGEPEAPMTVASFSAWYATLDAEFHAALSAFSEDDLQTKQIDRGHGFTPTAFVQYQIYREAQYILCGKASVYLKALEKTLTDDWKVGIG